MRYVLGIAAGICAGIAILATVYGLNKVNDWHEHRVVSLAHVAVLEGDPGYPNRDSNIKSELEQIAVLDQEVWKNGLSSALALILSAGAFVPLWHQVLLKPGITSAVSLDGLRALH